MNTAIGLLPRQVASQAIMYTEVWTAGLSGDFSGTALNVIPGNEVAWASSEIGGDCYYSGGLCSGGHNPGNYLPGKNIFTRPSEDWFRR